MFSKTFDRRIYVAAAAFVFAGTLGVTFGTFILWPSNREAGYEPRQPINFSHKLHAGEMQIDCLYCHGNAKRGPHAGVPAVSVCMNCHQEVQPKDAEGNITTEIAKLLDHWDNKKPIVWNKVNDLADFVYFDHSRHISGGVDCTECHGQVQEMDVVYRAEGLKMSWCLDCHKQPLEEDSPRHAMGWTTRAPINCTTCHR